MRESLLASLRLHQRGPAQHLVQVLRRYKTAVDWSDTGTGKTYVASAVAADLALPFLCVVPKIAQTQWRRAAEHFGENFSLIGWEMLRAGRTPYGKWEKGLPPESSSRRYFKCINCQCVVNLDPREFRPCFAHHFGIHCLETKTQPHHYGRFIFSDAVKGIIFDEIHRAAHDSLNADMVIAAKRQGIFTLGLSATPAQSPIQMRSLGYLLDLHRLTDFHDWLLHYQCRYFPRQGYRWLVGKDKQLEIMANLRASVIPDRGVRVTTESIPNFPKCEIRAELFDLPKKDSDKMSQLYQTMADALFDLADRQKLDKAPDLALTKILREHQQIELLKVPLAGELGADKLDQGFSVVWFVNYRQTIDELFKRFPDALIIDGSPESVKVRQKNVDKFLSNECRALIVNSKAGGVALSLEDRDGQHPRSGFVMPMFSATGIKQVFGRLPRESGKSACFYTVLFCSGTIETKMHRVLSQKLNNMDSLTDGDLDPRNLLVSE